MTQPSHFWVFTQKIWTVCQTDIHTHALVHHSSVHGSHVMEIHQQLGWWEEQGLDTPWSAASSWWEREFCFVILRMQSESLIPSEIPQARKGKYHMPWLLQGTQNNRIPSKRENRGHRDWRAGRGGVIAGGYKISFKQRTVFSICFPYC